MNSFLFATKGHSAALEYAVKELISAGWVQSDTAPIVLLPVPSFDKSGTLKGGGDLRDLPQDALIVGGNLQHTALKGRRCLDLLQNHLYLSENAAITAYCALCIIMENLPVILDGCPILVVGWGRIGKCLVRLLRQLGARITVAARSEADRALLEALGYRAADPGKEIPHMEQFRVIVNTVPYMVLPKEKLTACQHSCIKIDLASIPGIEGDDVIQARGLPSLDAPESSGKLIARMIRKEFEGCK